MLKRNTIGIHVSYGHGLLQPLSFSSDYDRGAYAVQHIQWQAPYKSALTNVIMPIVKLANA